jgi:hypothetical protein
MKSDSDGGATRMVSIGSRGNEVVTCLVIHNPLVEALDYRATTAEGIEVSDLVIPQRIQKDRKGVNDEEKAMIVAGLMDSTPI